MGKGPFAAGEMQKWFSIKIMGYSLMLVIGLKLRFIMREWTGMFRVLASGPDTDVEIPWRSLFAQDAAGLMSTGLASAQWLSLA